jgi:hypothetical protein
MSKATREQYNAIRDRVIRGCWHSRYYEDSQAAYAEAEELFSPSQMGALHRAMRQAHDECEVADLNRFIYGEVCR